MSLPQTTPIAGSPRLPGLDVVRALAALSVVSSHALESATIWSPAWMAHASPLVAVRIADATRAMGAWGVGIFFVLSGLCVHLPMARKLAVLPTAQLDLKRYAHRRFWRIYPPHLIVIFLSIAAALVAPPSDMVSVPTWGQLVAHLAMVHTFVPGAAFSVNHVLWSIALEAQFYLLYPLLLRARRRFSLAQITAALFVLGLAARGVDHYGLLPAGVSASQSVFGRFWEWSLGAAAAEHLVARRSLFGPWWLWLAASFAIPIATSSHPFSISVAITVCPFACAAALIGIARLPAAAGGQVENLLLQIGLRSYSLYLIHPIVYALLRVPFAALGPIAAAVALLFASLATAFVYFELVELPFMNKAAKGSARTTVPG